MPYSNVEFTNVIGSIGGKITLGEMKNGSFSVDKLNAFEGESVQVTITPNEDYDVDLMLLPKAVHNSVARDATKNKQIFLCATCSARLRGLLIHG